VASAASHSSARLGSAAPFLVDVYVADGTAITVARRNFPKRFLHYHRAGHGAVTSPQTQRGYTAFVRTKLSRVQGASDLKFADVPNVLAASFNVPAARLAAEIVSGRLARRSSARPHRHVCGHGLFHPEITG
jgi:ribulose 1,5-bisphosphate carboxylase large subunit-like protein